MTSARVLEAGAMADGSTLGMASPLAWCFGLGHGAGETAAAASQSAMPDSSRQRQLRGGVGSMAARTALRSAAAGAELLMGTAALVTAATSIAARRRLRRAPLAAHRRRPCEPLPAVGAGAASLLPPRRGVACRVAVGSHIPEGEEAATEDEIRMASGVTLGANFSLRPVTWPPTQGARDERLNPAKDRLEGRSGGGAGARSVPPLEHWPYYTVDIAELPLLEQDDEEWLTYRTMDMTNDLQRAYALADNWKQFNTGRSLSFLQRGAAKLASNVLTLPIITRQLQGLAAYRKWVVKEKADDTEPEFERFLAESGADEITANELRCVVRGTRHGVNPEDIFALPEGEPSTLSELRVDTVIGMAEGNALAIWAVGPGPGATARVEFCIGHDCVETGPVAEEILLRHIATKAAAMGAERLQCRVRFTNDGLFVVPPAFKKLGLVRSEELWDSDFEQDTEEDSPLGKEAALVEEGESVLSTVDAIPESVPGLKVWLTVQGLENHIEAANAWCEEMGAATLDEVVESREDLCECMGGLLTEQQRQKMLARQY